MIHIHIHTRRHDIHRLGDVIHIHTWRYDTHRYGDMIQTWNTHGDTDIDIQTRDMIHMHKYGDIIHTDMET